MYHDALVAAEMCLTSKPACECLAKYDHLLEAAAACLKDVAEYMHDMFSVCDTTGPTCTPAYHRRRHRSVPPPVASARMLT